MASLNAVECECGSCGKVFYLQAPSNTVIDPFTGESRPAGLDDVSGSCPYCSEFYGKRAQIIVKFAWVGLPNFKSSAVSVSIDGMQKSNLENRRLKELVTTEGVHKIKFYYSRGGNKRVTRNLSFDLRHGSYVTFYPGILRFEVSVDGESYKLFW